MRSKSGGMSCLEYLFNLLTANVNDCTMSNKDPGQSRYRQSSKPLSTKFNGDIFGGNGNG